MAKKVTATMEKSGLTKNQHKDIETFLHLFADTEAALKKRLNRRSTDPTGVKNLIDDYAAKTPYWVDSANCLRNLADIRNLLTHQRGVSCGYPIALAPTSLKSLEIIKDGLLNSEQVSLKYRRTVRSVSVDDSVGLVLRLAYENGFSQFPALSDGQFGGLITETEITRWLGHKTKANTFEIDLAAVTVRMVLKEKDPWLKGISLFRFARLDSPVHEVMSRFFSEPALEVVLLTATGNKNAQIEGIVTQWDAARYSR